MNDQIIDATTARALQVDANRRYVQSAWIIHHDAPAHPGKYVARFATDHPTIYVVVADTLAEVQAALPSGLERSARQAADPPDVVEVWFSGAYSRGRKTRPSASGRQPVTRCNERRSGSSVRIHA